MASNYYPMVSSSPPPLDDGTSFEDDEGDEFGHFTSAGTSFGNDLIEEKLKVDDGDATTKDTLTRLNCLNAGTSFHISNGQSNGTDLTANGYGQDCDVMHESIQSSYYLDHIQLSPEQLQCCDSIPSRVCTDDDKVSSVQLEQTYEHDFRNNLSGIMAQSDDTGYLERTCKSVESSEEKKSNKDENVLIGHSDGDNADPTCKHELELWNDCPDDALRPVEEPVGPSDIPIPASVSEPTDNLECPEDCNKDYTESVEDQFEQFNASFDDFTEFQTASTSNFDENFAENDLGKATLDGEVNDAINEVNFAAFDEHREEFFPTQVDEYGSKQSSETCKDEDEFGTFNSASTECPIEFSSYTEPVRPSVSLVLASAFPKSILDKPDVLVKKLDEVLNTSTPQNDSKTLKNLWSHLYDIDNTQALTYHWNHSQSNKKLLHSLRIDTRNFLAGTKWNSSVPLFAATLGSNPLEPKKATCSAGDGENSISPSAMATLKLGCAQESTVPPAQFDWGSSGLVNPLDDSTSSALLDLDFFLTNDIYSVHSATASSSRHINSLETEFLGSGPNSVESKTPSNVLNNSPILDKILLQAAQSASASSTSFYAPTRHRASNLSAEAIHVLDSLPNLSFMRAKVLMFPIRGSLT